MNTTEIFETKVIGNIFQNIYFPISQHYSLISPVLNGYIRDLQEIEKSFTVNSQEKKIFKDYINNLQNLTHDSMITNEFLYKLNQALFFNINQIGHIVNQIFW